MKSVPLGKLTTLVSSGSTPLGGSKIYLPTGPVMLIRSQNVLMRELNLDDVAFITEEVASKMKRTVVKTNDVFFNITGASIGRVATFELQGVQANVNQHVCIIRTVPELLHHRYLMHFIAQPSFQAYINNTQQGGTRQALTFEKIRDFQIPLLPLEEQRRIATILDKADAVRRKRKEAIALTEELLRSAFLEMFGDPVLNPKGWSQRQLGELLSIVSGQVDPQAHPYIDMPHIGGENIESNTGHLSGVQTPRELGLKSGKYLFEPTDVLYSKIRPYLNKVVIPGFTGVCSADIYPLRVDESQLDQRYLVYLLRSKIFLTYAEKHSARTNIPKVNRPALLKFTLPHPPLALQKEFSVIYSRVECVRNRFESAVENDLFNSLLQRAFRGEL